MTAAHAAPAFSMHCYVQCIMMTPWWMLHFSHCISLPLFMCLPASSLDDLQRETKKQNKADG